MTDFSNYALILVDKTQVTTQRLESIPTVAVLELDDALHNRAMDEAEKYEQWKEELREDHVRGDVDDSR